jgi:hypothetical protein
MCCFFRGFLEKRDAEDVFLWSDHGAMRGKSGLITNTFEPSENMQEFELIYHRRGNS